MKPLRGQTRSFRRMLQIRFAKLMRWLHIYLSMFSLAVVLFFSVTGITLNHPDWFYDAAQGQRSADGDLDLRWLRPGNQPEGSPATLAVDTTNQVAKLEIVEHLRAVHAIRGALTDFRVDETECLVSFKGPGYAADAFVDRESGHYRVNESYHGLVAIINDLHKGRDTGTVWSVVIDISAVLMTVVSLTGLVLLFYLKLRRVTGVIVALAATVIVILLYRFGVP
jgi:uncharacterized protein